MVKITEIFYGKRSYNSLKENEDMIGLLKEIEQLPPMKLRYVQLPRPSAIERHVLIYEGNSGKLCFDVGDYGRDFEHKEVSVTTGRGKYFVEDGILKEIIMLPAESPKLFTERDYQRLKKTKRETKIVEKP